MSTKTPTIKLGICMAGAVSAGAYTAGVIDYLLETLERWQIEKDKIKAKLDKDEELTAFEKSVPMHNVEIEVLSGASAGGMTAAIMLYSFIDGKYVTRNEQNQLINQSYGLPFSHENKSKLYESWVEMADSPQQSTLEKMLDTDDVKDITEMESLLNCKAIELVAKKACPPQYPSPVVLPQFVSKELTAYLTITNIDGLPIDIRFSNTTESKNQFKMHNMLLGFTFSNAPELAHPCTFIQKGNYKKIIDAAIATGAFPFGLKPHGVTLSNAEMKIYAAFLKKQYSIEVDSSSYTGKDYSFMAVDGGLINNEPYGINAKHLNTVSSDEDKKSNKNFMIYVDPFPSVTNTGIQPEEIEKPKELTLFNMAIRLFQAVRNQSMLKQDDLFQAIDMQKNKYMIYPRKNRLYFLACGMLGGFSGFLRKQFRKHDYQLGRKNCQAFLRYYFGKKLDFFEDLGVTITDDAIEKIGYYPSFDNTKPIRVPLIPDMLFLKNPKAKEIDNPVFQNLTQTEFEHIIQLVSNRLSKIIDKSYWTFIQFIPIKSSIKSFIAFFGQRFFKRKIQNNLLNKASGALKDLVKPQNIYQKDLVALAADRIESKGSKYFKHKEVYIRPATHGEKVESITSDGLETVKIASSEDYVVTNQTSAREKYVISKNTFEKYECVNETECIYKMNEQYVISALPFTKENFPELFEKTFFNELDKPYIYIEAAWGESQKVLEGDYLILNEREIYRVGKIEFEETYEIV